MKSRALEALLNRMRKGDVGRIVGAPLDGPSGVANLI